MIGNSSSGLLEMPTFKKYSINIGERQLGRLKAKSVIDCNYNTRSIIKAMNFSFNPINKKKLKISLIPMALRCFKKIIIF